MIFRREIFWSVLFGIIFLSHYGAKSVAIRVIGWVDVAISLVYLISVWHRDSLKRRIEDREERRKFNTWLNDKMNVVMLLWSLVYFILFWVYLKSIQDENIGVVLFLSCSLFPKFALLLGIVAGSILIVFLVIYRIRHPDDEHVRGRGLDFIGSSTLIEVMANSPFLESSNKCAICLSEYQEGESLRRMPCDHTFHRECVDHWLESRTTCPYCRADLRQEGGTEDLIHSIGNPQRGNPERVV